MRLFAGTDPGFTGDTLHPEKGIVMLCKALCVQMAFVPFSGHTLTWGNGWLGGLGGHGLVFFIDTDMRAAQKMERCYHPLG